MSITVVVSEYVEMDCMGRSSSRHIARQILTHLSDSYKVSCAHPPGRLLDPVVDWRGIFYHDRELF